MKKSISYLFKTIAILWIIGNLSACQDDRKLTETTKLKVISSFSILTDMIEEIGRDSVMVHNLVPVGTDPHEYSPIPEDIKFASQADLFFYNGLNLEGGESGWFFKLIYSLGIDTHQTVETTQNIQPMYLTEKDGSQEVNPHAFINPKVGISMAKIVEEALIKADPDSRLYYEKNAEEYLSQLKKVEQEYRKKMGEIPPQNRVFIASEQAFQYLNAEYGLKEGFIWAIDTEENGSPNQIKDAIAFVKENHPPVLFVESNVDIRPMNTISEETGVPIYQPAIYSDELGKPGQEADTYLGYLEYNLKHITHGLMGRK